MSGLPDIMGALLTDLSRSVIFLIVLEKYLSKGM